MRHSENDYGNGSGKVWRGWDAAGTNSTVFSTAVDAWPSGRLKIAQLPTALNWTTADVTVTFSWAVFQPGDYLRVGDEILYVESANGSTYVLKRAQAGRPAASPSRPTSSATSWSPKQSMSQYGSCETTTGTTPPTQNLRSTRLSQA